MVEICNPRPVARWRARRRRALVAVAAGLAADWLLGEPPPRWHPVAKFGGAMGWIESRWYADSRRLGASHALAGLGLAATAGWLLGAAATTAAGTRTAGATTAGATKAGTDRRRRRAARPAEPGGALAVALATYVAVAGRALGVAARQVADALQAGDLDAARAGLPALVGRDPAGLDEQEMARAVVESVAENTVDAVVAAAVWAAIGGAPGVFAYRAINTLDAMVGHRSPRYARYGWAAARLDDAAGWVPARLTAVLVAAVRPASAARVWDAVRWQAAAHPSPNAGVAEAAFAAALGVRLGGRSVYDGRPEDRPPLGTGEGPVVADIDRTIRLSRDVTATMAGLGLLLAGRWWRR
jgi:adenosylcobinamide-phosphate synthase